MVGEERAPPRGARVQAAGGGRDTVAGRWGANASAEAVSAMSARISERSILSAGWLRRGGGVGRLTREEVLSART